MKMNEGEVNGLRYVGIDISKRKCRAAIVDEDGVLIKEFSFFNDFSGIECFVRELSDGDSVVMDLQGTFGLTFMRLLREMGLKRFWLIL